MHFCVQKDVRKILKYNKSITSNLKLYETLMKYLSQTVMYNKIYTINISFNFQYNKRIHRMTHIIKNVIKYYKKEKKEKRLTKKNFQFHDRHTLLFLKSRGMCQKLSTFG